MSKTPKLKKHTQLVLIKLRRRKMRDRLLQRSFFGGVLIIGLVGLLLQITGIKPASVLADNLNRQVLADIYKDYNTMTPKILELENEQAKSGITAVNAQTIQNDISPIYYYAENGDVAAARKSLIKLQQDYLVWKALYDKQVDARKAEALVATPKIPAAPSINVPILIYHKTPSDFDNQLQYLQNHGYTTITPHQLVLALQHTGGLPTKPVIITYDDGFSDQMTAYALLRKHSMKATYYIITGGAASGWCIGVHRDYSRPCGDGYLNEDQIRELDTSGVIDIESHTVDHLNLASLPADQQRFQVEVGKQQLEAIVGHPVLDFAYPYGSFSATTIAIVKEAGFESAVSTIPGTVQSLGNLYSLYRVRDPYKLP